MTDESFVRAYFERINYHGSTDVSVKTLHDLHAAHTLNIPFENLDVYLGRPILLDQDSLYEKIIVNKRGGDCFEMNGLFSLVLKTLGFKVTDLLARGTRDGINYHAKTHQVLLVEVDGEKWMCDVGYGNDGIMTPLLLKVGLEQKQIANTYRFGWHEKYGYVLHKEEENNFMPMYAFTLEECTFDDLLMSNHFTSTFPGAFFTMVKVCTMPTPDGRLTLFNDMFKILKNGQVTERKLTTEEEFKEVLREYFKLDYDAICKSS